MTVTWRDVQKALAAHGVNGRQHWHRSDDGNQRWFFWQPLDHYPVVVSIALGSQRSLLDVDWHAWHQVSTTQFQQWVQQTLDCDSNAKGWLTAKVATDELLELIDVVLPAVKLLVIELSAEITARLHHAN